MPVYLCNNANAAALGWREANDGYDDVTFYSQATGWAVGGQGHVVGGRLVEGAHGNAGEVKYIAPYARRQYYGTAQTRSYDPRRGGMWFERMKTANKDQILRLINS